MPFGAGQIVYEDDLATVIAAITPVETTVAATVGTVATGFAINDVRVCTLMNGADIDLDLYISRTGANIVATAGNIADTLIFTLATAFRPTHAKTLPWGNGSSSGEAVINPDGTINLRTASSDISGTAGGGITNLRLSSRYIKTA